MSSPRRRCTSTVPPGWVRVALTLLITLSTLLSATSFARAIDFPYLIFTWGKRLEFLEQTTHVEIDVGHHTQVLRLLLAHAFPVGRNELLWRGQRVVR